MNSETFYFLTPFDIGKIRQAQAGELPMSLELSTDAGKSLTTVLFTADRRMRIGREFLPLPDLDDIGDDPRSILKFESGQWQKWQRFDPVTRKFYKMVFVAPGKPPTVEISGIKMHVTMNGDPEKDTISKLKTLGKLHGQILDTCMGLGYTAIAAAQQPDVQKVTVCEADANMYRLCRENPWSAGLFENPEIHPVLKPVQEYIHDIPDESVNAVIHDPPRFALAPQLYSEQFYRQLHRILTAKGKIYHYTGDPNRRTRRSSLPQKTMSLLKKVGFRKVRESYFGVNAFK